MAVTLYTSNGTPADATGVQGDMNIDYGGRFLWGPKGASTWAGTANSIVGPTGPVSSVMGGFCGAQAIISSPTTLSATPTVLLQPNGVAQPQVFVAGANNSFVGALLYAVTGGATFELYNLTAGTSVYKSAALASASASVVGQFAYLTYPLIAGNSYVWRVTGSASFTGYVNPIYWSSAAGYGPNGGAISAAPVFQHIGALSTSTASNMGPLGDNIGSFFYANPRGGVAYNVTASVAPGATGTAIFYLYNLSTANTVYTVNDYAGNAMALSAGQSFTSPYLGTALTATQYYQWRVYAGTAGSGTYTLTMQVAQ